MKKYVKPELLYESFVLSEQIATCDYDSKGTFNDPDQCTFTGENPAGVYGVYFTDSNNTCEIKFEGYCYTNSTFGANLFNS